MSNIDANGSRPSTIGRLLISFRFVWTQLVVYFFLVGWFVALNFLFMHASVSPLTMHIIDVFFFFFIVFGTLFLYRYMFSRGTMDEPHNVFQLFILIITVGSFFAFGWPNEHKFTTENHAFTELAVIFVLFMLSELAVALLLTAQKMEHELVATGQGIATSLFNTTKDAITEIKSQTGPIVAQLTDLRQNLNADKITESVSVLASVHEVGRAITILQDHRVQRMLVEEISKYAQSWAAFLQSCYGDSVLHDKLRFQCVQRFFANYLTTEIQNLGYDFASTSLKKRSIRIVSNDELFLVILRELMQTLIDGGNNVCVRVITNISPYDYYHWGRQYGRLGCHGFMDGYRNAIAELVRRQKGFERLFLLSSNYETQPSAANVGGLFLYPFKEIENQDDLVLLLVRDHGTAFADERDDEPQVVNRWKELGVLQNLVDDGRAVAVSDARFYGIVSKTVLGGKGWTLNQDNRVEIPRRAYDLVVRPVALLEHFERKYQSADGMRFGIIEGRDDLAPLPMRNPDYLMLGTRDNGIYMPILALSSNIVPNTDTMSLELFTSQADLEQIQDFWNKNWKESKSLADVRAAKGSRPAAPQTP